MIRIRTKDGYTGEIVGTNFTGTPLIRLDSWTNEDIARMGGEDNAWVILSEKQYDIIRDEYWDFKGWVVLYNTEIKLGYKFTPGCFKHQDNKIIPLIASLDNTDITEYNFGYAILEERKEGVYCYGYIEDSERPLIKNIRDMLHEGKLTHICVYADAINTNHNDCNIINADIKDISLLDANHTNNLSARIEVIQI